MSHVNGLTQFYQAEGFDHRSPLTGVKLALDQLTASEAARVELRARRIYLDLPPTIPWRDTDEPTRDDFRRRAMKLMLLDGSLLHGTLPGSEDYGYTEEQELDREVAAVIRGELYAGELWRPEVPDEGGSDGN